MITDDPGTPGNGHWENNFAITFEHRGSETSLEAPALDFNYGLGEYIQLTLQTSAALLTRDGHGTIGGLGSVEAAVKWRFLDEDRAGLSVSTFPRIIFNLAHSSVRRGLAEDGTRVQFPLEAAKRFGRFDVGVEFGPLFSTVGRSEWLYGIVAGTSLTKKTAVMAELQGTSRINFSDDVLTANFGLRQELNGWCTFIGSLGHELRAPGKEPLALIGYAGMQLTF
ncbi:MAG: hypothetical protein ACREFG_08880 [Chthoniobacterales bacterium]